MPNPALRVLETEAGNTADSVRDSVRAWLVDFDASELSDWRLGFEIARRVQRGIVEAGGNPAKVEAAEYLPEVRTYAEGAGLDSDELAIGYEVAWPSVRYPHGQGACERAFAESNAFAKRISLKWKIASPKLRRQAELIKLTIWYLERDNKSSAYLSSRKAGELLGVHYTYAANILKNLVKYGDLVLLAPATKHQAARYAWPPRCNLQSTEY